MHDLNEREIYEALQYAKSIDDETTLAQTIFGVFPTVIAEQDKDMSHLFMGLCFDVIYVFENTYGTLPSQRDMDINWLEKQKMLLDTELQAQTHGLQIHERGHR